MPLKCAIHGYDNDRVKVAHPGDGSVFIVVPSKAVGLPHAALGRESKLAATMAAKRAAEEMIAALDEDIAELSAYK